MTQAARDAYGRSSTSPRSLARPVAVLFRANASLQMTGMRMSSRVCSTRAGQASAYDADCRSVVRAARSASPPAATDRWAGRASQRTAEDGLMSQEIGEAADVLPRRFHSGGTPSRVALRIPDSCQTPTRASALGAICAILAVRVRPRPMANLCPVWSAAVDEWTETRRVSRVPDSAGHGSHSRVAPASLAFAPCGRPTMTPDSPGRSGRDGRAWKHGAGWAALDRL